MKPQVQIGQFGKTHGIAGEINAMLDTDGIDLAALRCIFIDIDGLRVPFFIESVRPKGNELMLVKIDGYDSQEAVKQFVNKEIYAEADEIETAEDEDNDADGFYVSDLVGFDARTTDGTLIGRVTDYDDNTANVLFIVDRTDGTKAYIPVADELVAEVDTSSRTIFFSLPDGLLNL